LLKGMQWSYRYLQTYSSGHVSPNPSKICNLRITTTKPCKNPLKYTILGIVRHRSHAEIYFTTNDHAFLSLFIHYNNVGVKPVSLQKGRCRPPGRTWKCQRNPLSVRTP